MKSFIDEDWTGLSKRKIWTEIVAEEEEQQCRSEGHRWVPAFYCQNCGLQASEALEAFKEKENMTTTMRRTQQRKKGR